MTNTTFKLASALGLTALLAVCTHGQTNVFSTSGDAGMAAENTLYFGREELFGGSDTGGADYGYIHFRNHAAEYAYWGVSGENSALIIGTQNDSYGSNSDSLVLKGSAANIFDSPFNLFTGKVGIGSNAPTAKLEVYGGVLGGVTGDLIEYARLWQTDNNSDNLRIIGLRTQAGTGWNTADLIIHRRVDASDMGYVKFTDWDLALGSGSTEAVRIKSNGNVGIGTTNPTHKLAVNGTIKAKEVIVETSGWSDYVFADDYALTPLADVEAHIKEHKHLPGIPSAAQVADHGISIGDMQAKLLAKIEELTLHVIAQEKRALVQEARAMEQDKEIAALRTQVSDLRSGRP